MHRETPTHSRILRQRRKARIRAKIFGTKNRPRLSVFRGSKHLFVQLVDDEARHTLLALSSRALAKKRSKSKVLSGKDRAFALGEMLAKQAGKKGIKRAVFDRSWYAYHGRVAALAEGARKGGLEF